MLFRYFITLDDDAFKELVAGREARMLKIEGGVEWEFRVILSDIGWDRMRQLIDEAENNSN